ncbi:MAG: hypothetical protein M3O34_05675 [Chloroflexota bacterium]|nr:hypothetical protein [Chloroflexota bacterium]
MTDDRLIRLSMTRAALHHNRLITVDAWNAATPEQRAQLGPDQRAFVERAIRDGQVDVLTALFSDAIAWGVAVNQSGADERLLTFKYRADDPEGERRAWAAIRAATR